jgi:hypothetical protein
MSRNLSTIRFVAAVGFLFGTMLASVAFAQSGAQGAGINPQCTAMGKPRQCTCALETGGVIEPGGKRWRYYNVNRYTACMVQHKWL